MHWIVLSSYLISCMRRMRLVFDGSLRIPMMFISLVAKPSVYKMVESVEQQVYDEMPLLDLPELALDSILERLSSAEWCSMTRVCRFLRERCRSDHLRERHMNQKWGRVIGDIAYRKWQCHMTSNKRSLLNKTRCKGYLGYMMSFLPFAVARSNLESKSKYDGYFPVDDSVMAQYLSLESGKFWFPAQVYNRENGHGFMLSCHDVELSYNSTTDTFQARYSPRRRHIIEENISWDRLRAPPLDTPPYDLHISDCLEDLKLEDHIEFQWRRNKYFPYGWWYGVVGHLDSCTRTESFCQCHYSSEESYYTMKRVCNL